MVWTIGGVTLPHAPSKMTMPKNCIRDGIQQDQGYQHIVVSGLNSEVRLEGTISEAGHTAAQLVSDYISTLEALIGTEVAVTTTDGLIDGDWLLDSFEVSKDSPFPSFKYTMRLVKADEIVTYG